MTHHRQANTQRPAGPAARGSSRRARSLATSPVTDLANARRLAARHGRDLRYCHPWGKWLVWTGLCWRTDDTGEVARRAKDAVSGIYSEAQAATDNQARMELAQWAVRSESEARIKAMISLAESEPGIAVTPDELDADLWLFNVRNGTVDLRTGELLPHRRDDLITIVAPVEHDPEATCPLWEAFLDRIFAGNDHLIGFMQRSLGYALTGDVSEQVLFIHHGIGANGKTTLQNIVLGILGDYGKVTPPGLLLQRNHDRHPTEIADLKGARFVASVEIGEGKALAEELVKRLTGGDRLKGRFMRQDFWEFDPTHKLFVACNHRPAVSGTDPAIWRRIRLVPFTVQIPEEEQDKGLQAKMLARERSGILNWLIAGCLAWQGEGLGAPEEVKAATSEYRTEQDVVGRFLADCCVEGTGLVVKKAALYLAYQFWSPNNDEESLSQRLLSQRLQERGFRGERRGSAGDHYWLGLGLKKNHGPEEGAR